MIIGGVGGVFRTGGTKVGYSETFFPIQIVNVSSTVNAAFLENLPVVYDARVRIQTVDQASWVTLTDVTNMSIYLSSTRGSASLTVRKTETWNISGDLYPLLLDPSLRKIEIYCGITVRGARIESLVFIGRILNYSEVHGREGSSINLNCESLPNALKNIESNTVGQVARTLTLYRALDELMNQSGLFQTGQPFAFLYEDIVMEPVALAGNIRTIVAILVPDAIVSALDSGGIKIASKNIPGSETAYEFSDNNIGSLTRSFARTYNAISVIGSVYSWLEQSSVVVRGTATNEPDILKRGRFNSPTTAGSASTNYYTNLVDTARKIENELKGKLTFKTRFNPLLLLSAKISISSEKMNKEYQARADKITISYAHGNASMTLSDVVIENEIG